MRKAGKYISVVFVLLIGLVLTSYYFLIFSPVTANMGKIITLRNAYVPWMRDWRQRLNMTELRTVYDYLYAPVRVTSKRTDTIYWYTVSGKIVSVDSLNQTMTLRAENNKEYIFSVTMDDAEKSGWVGIPGTYDAAEPGSRDETVYWFSMSDIEQSGEMDPWYKKNQIYNIVWSDERKLTQIMADYKRHPDEPIDISADKVRSLWRSNEEI